MIRAETAHESEHWKNRDDVGQRCSQTTMDSVSTALESRTESEPIENLLGEGFTVIKGGMIVFLSAVLSQVLTLVTSMWITRALGPDQYGLYSLSLSVLVPIISLASLGLDQTIVRFMPVFVGRQENDRVKGVLYSSWEMASATSLMLAAMVAILAPLIADKVFHDSRMSFVLRALTLTIPFTVLTNIALSATRGLKVMHFDAGIRVARTLFRLVIWGVALYLLQNPLRAAVYGTVSAQAITAALTFGLVFWVFRAFLRSNIERMYKMLLKYALPLTLSVLMYSLIPRIDQLLLGTLVETRIVGIYSAAVGVAVCLDMVHYSIVTAFLPSVADTYNRISPRRARKLYSIATRWDACLTFALVTGTILMGKDIFALLGESYSEALLPFTLLAVKAYLGSMTGPTGGFLQMTNRQRWEVLNALLYLGLGTLLQLTFATYVGWIGVAVGTLVGVLLLNVVQVIEIGFLYGFTPFHDREHTVFCIVSLVILIPVALVGNRATFIVRALSLAVVPTVLMVYAHLTHSLEELKGLWRLIRR